MAPLFSNAYEWHRARTHADDRKVGRKKLKLLSQNIQA
jgi:hypothetical protein